MTISNMALSVFLALRNTPLSFLVPVTHVELNVLHRLTGIVAVLFIIAHAVLYTAALYTYGHLEHLLNPTDIAGIIAGISMVILLVGLVRHARRTYTAFYVSHILFFVLAVILAVAHRPNVAKKLPQAMLFTLGIWMVDRTIRGLGVLRYVFTTRATAHALPGGATQIFLRGGGRAVPGAHCFIWVPRLSLTHSRPMTIVDNGPEGVEMVIRGYDGVTRRLGELAAGKEGAVRLWAFAGLSYGARPSVEGYDRLVLVAGGSGASFVFGFVNGLRGGVGGLERVDCVCSFQRRGECSHGVCVGWHLTVTEHVAWYGQHLDNLGDMVPETNIQLHVTRGVHMGPVYGTMDTRQESLGKYGDETGTVETVVEQTPSRDEYSCRHPVTFGRVDVEQVLGRPGTNKDGSPSRVLVVTCGPQGLTDAVRDAVEQQRAVDPLGVMDLYCGDYGD